ncbi:MaoC family dehydratase N-terminal domain-containing protein [Acuticoccus sp. M5D2P5]|uniref:FAS1-like dehydratase domain-containing protein n=1 Tax=Acuticoccus kalidii TaxID=2910977 RepID=UPI001F43100D|nr:MaoC family dehydratase N-terminal domain-containing protein [Acuticoccus kalidii]MCF3932419.1 MaoC family dehydratase N-terminal domain-containing protein [Acuticoccus kalidii]
MEDKTALWIGRTSRREDIVTHRLVDQFVATLAPHLAGGVEVPLGLLWCLAPDALPAANLGRDGHPRLGIVLPDLGYQRRMWAGGELIFEGGRLALGDTVIKTSTIDDISFKSGRSGRLAFVTLAHRYEAGGALVLTERQDIVYRDDPDPSAPPPRAPTPAAPAPDGASRLSIETTPTLLFRYSALTFNGHRIHYDAAYASEVEGYRGLVVHGPLQATMMLNLVAERLGRPPRRFAYRGLSPLIAGGTMTVEAFEAEDGTLIARVLSPDGIETHRATAER